MTYTDEELSDIERRATGELWICDNGLCEYLEPVAQEAKRARAALTTANALLAEALKELDTIEALTASPTDVDGLMDLVKRMRAHLEGR